VTIKSAWFILLGNMSVPTSRTTPSPSLTSDKQSRVYATSTTVRFPPTPPGTDIDSDDGTSASTRLDVPLPPPSAAQRILNVDKPTPDAHVPRDPRLIRLTGAHPFNAEAPLGDLYNEGFLTTPDLFYVRNHGAVPEVQDAECLHWEISVEGYGSQRTSLSKLTWRQACGESVENHTAAFARRVRKCHISDNSGLRRQQEKRAERCQKKQRLLLGSSRRIDCIVHRCRNERCHRESEATEASKIRLHGGCRQACEFCSGMKIQSLMRTA
jgi:hypothetical protein